MKEKIKMFLILSRIILILSSFATIFFWYSLNKIYNYYTFSLVVMFGIDLLFMNFHNTTDYITSIIIKFLYLIYVINSIILLTFLILQSNVCPSNFCNTLSISSSIICLNTILTLLLLFIFNKSSNKIEINQV